MNFYSFFFVSLELDAINSTNERIYELFKFINGHQWYVIQEDMVMTVFILWVAGCCCCTLKKPPQLRTPFLAVFSSYRFFSFFSPMGIKLLVWKTRSLYRRESRRLLLKKKKSQIFLSISSYGALFHIKMISKCRQWKKINIPICVFFKPMFRLHKKWIKPMKISLFWGAIVLLSVCLAHMSHHFSSTAMSTRLCNFHTYVIFFFSLCLPRSHFCSCPVTVRSFSMLPQKMRTLNQGMHRMTKWGTAHMKMYVYSSRFLKNSPICFLKYLQFVFSLHCLRFFFSIYIATTFLNIFI